MTPSFTKGLRPGLYAITDSTLVPPEHLVAAVESAIHGGAVLVQYRDKHSSERLRQQQAEALQALCAGLAVPLLINDDPLLAKRVGAAGVHLGQTDSGLAEARELLGNDAIIGITCHGDLALARAAHEGGADYLAFGRFFSSTTKPGASPANKQVLAEAKQFGRPVTAIGGITASNGAELVRSGADLLAVIGDLFKHDRLSDIEAQARRFSQLFSDHHPLFHR